MSGAQTVLYGLDNDFLKYTNVKATKMTDIQDEKILGVVSWQTLCMEIRKKRIHSMHPSCGGAIDNNKIKKRKKAKRVDKARE